MSNRFKLITRLPAMKLTGKKHNKIKFKMRL